MPDVTRCLVALAMVLLVGCSGEQKTAAPAAEPATEAAAAFPATADLSFNLAPGTCTDHKCAPLVQLLAAGKPIDTAPLDFPASGPELNKGVADKLMGAGDPLQKSEQLPAAWTGGDGEGRVATALRSMKLSGQQTGLLVDQAAGFEHVKRRHYLYVSENRKLKRVWTGEEGAGPAWSAAILTEAGQGQGQQMVYLTGFQPGGAQPDTAAARRFTWDDATHSLVERPLGQLYAIVAGNFASPAEARAASTGNCLAEYSALQAPAIGISGAKIVLAVLTTQKSLADAALADTGNCPANIARKIVEVNQMAVAQP